jgi:type IV pilus assembly protein PilB
MPGVTRPKIGELLVEAHVLTREQLEHALRVKQEDGRKVGQVLVDLGYVTETQLTQTLSRQLSVPWVSLHHVELTRALLNLVPRAVAEKYNVLPIFVRNVRKQGETLYVATDDPTNEALLQELASGAGLPVRPMIACPTDVRNAIRVYYGEGEARANSPTLPPSEGEPMELDGTVLTSIPPSAPPSIEPLAASEPVTSVDPAPVSIPEPVSAPPETPASTSATEKTERKRGTRKNRPRMMSLTLLDGTSIQLPVSRRRAVEEEAPRGASDQLTARDLIDALRLSGQGVDMRQVLGENPRWEIFFAALLSVLLRKGLIADWEFVEELRKM